MKSKIVYRGVAVLTEKDEESKQRVMTLIRNNLKQKYKNEIQSVNTYEENDSCAYTLFPSDICVYTGNNDNLVNSIEVEKAALDYALRKNYQEKHSQKSSSNLITDMSWIDNALEELTKPTVHKFCIYIDYIDRENYILTLDDL